MDSCHARIGDLNEDSSYFFRQSVFQKCNSLNPDKGAAHDTHTQLFLIIMHRFHQVEAYTKSTLRFQYFKKGKQFDKDSGGLWSFINSEI
jgi:hypothetical protein